MQLRPYVIYTFSFPPPLFFFSRGQTVQWTVIRGDLVNTIQLLIDVYNIYLVLKHLASGYGIY
jgi:hypothetical protein